MPLISNYTISGMESLKRFPNMEVAQFTLNSRTWPGKRRTVEALRQIRPYHKSKVLVHYDYIYILSRYAMFSKQTRFAILDELVDLINYAYIDKSIAGIIMHTDWSLKRKITDGSSEALIKSEYAGTVWDADKISQQVSEHYKDWLEYNLSCFVEDLKYKFYQRGCKIYLENTTKVGPNKQGSFDDLVRILNKHPEWKKTFGLCLDSEHFYGVEGYFPNPVVDLGDIDYVVHLNTVPLGVEPGSLKDRHSETTIFECSVNKPELYFDMVKALRDNNKLFVREVKEETMFRELEQMRQWSSQ